MIEVVTLKGETYSFDPSTLRIFRDGILQSSTQVEPVYSEVDEFNNPKFAGFFMKDVNAILSLSGKMNYITDPNTIS